MIKMIVVFIVFSLIFSTLLWAKWPKDTKRIIAYGISGAALTAVTLSSIVYLF